MRRLVLLAALACAGCGANAADLFEVQRSGADPNANVTLLVSDDGTVTCNGREHLLDGPLLLRARDLARRLAEQAELNLALPPGPDPILSYRVRMEPGTIAFADTSRPLPAAFSELAVFTKDVTGDVCGLVRR